MSFLIDGKRPRQVPVTRVLECGRRVHGWQLEHDLDVDVLRSFPLYWERAQADGRRMRGLA